MSETTEVADVKPPINDQEMMNMFTTVWVKEEANNSEEIESDESPRRNPSVKRKRVVSSTKYRCDKCEYTTGYKNCFDLHIAGHNDAKPYSCEYCNYSTKYPTSLSRHVLVQHELKNDVEATKALPQYKCDECKYTTHFKWNLNAHRRKHKTEKQFACPHCSYETAYRHNFVKHSKVHNKQEVIYKCDKCPFVTKFEGHITRHLAKIHNEVTDKANKCDFCDFSTKTKWRLNIHKQRSKQANILKCSLCDFKTSYMCESKKHKVTHYSEIYGAKANINSTQLPEGAILNDTLSNFVQEHAPKLTQNTSHEKMNNYVLDPNNESDWNSIQVLESDRKDRPFQCIMCSYTSKFKASVQRHYQRHHTGPKNRPYKCTNCDFSTKTKDQIALHNKRSQSDTQLCCDTCQFVTFYKCQFLLHQKSHYAYKCSVCAYSCKHKYEFHRHYATGHMGDGMKCRFCDYKATRKESLLCHEMIHTGEKPFKCLLCDYTSVRKNLLDNHMKRYHSDVRSNVTVVSESKIQSLKMPLPEKMKQEALVMENCRSLLNAEHNALYENSSLEDCEKLDQ